MDKKKLVLLLVLLLLLAVVVVILMLDDTPQQVQTEPTVPANRVLSTNIEDVFKHCISVEKTSDGYFPLRFSEQRLKNYEIYPVIPYSRCTAGITMEFSTDAETISFDYEINKSFWNPTFDVYENGEYAATVECGQRIWGRFEYTKKAEGRVDIIITLPNAAETGILNPQLGNFTTDVTGDKAKVLVLGDSISQGLYGTGSSKNWVFLLSQELDFDYLNLSVGGETFRKSALDRDVPFQPDHIIVALGTNDLFYTRYLNVMEKEADRYLEQLDEIYPDVPVTIITPFWMRNLNSAANQDFRTLFLAYTKVLKELGAKYGYEVIDGTELIPNNAAYYADDVHPNEHGFAALADALKKRLTIGG